MAKRGHVGRRRTDDLVLTSRRHGQARAQDPWMTRGHPQQRQGRTLRAPAALFPVAQCGNADAERLGKLQLRQSDKSTKRDDILAPCDTSAEDWLTQLPRDRPSEVPIGQLVAHSFSPYVRLRTGKRRHRVRYGTDLHPRSGPCRRSPDSRRRFGRAPRLRRSRVANLRG